ncbi:hypothetical protein PV08_06012 [Exophiala spinifera]|uniref:CID domain-containing protein n=1 Tax=Exophiala spinifera TaxID=91928 RepID=A0A0D1ZT55_9EURO|nr:uncharacterized protein PV08_06012 [Exophiala spinifera]KIW15962.1 hypothetical protein PV08_06012 [Exophiala spinifera]
MSFSDEALKAKLSTLNETQDSIVSVSQWIMFHKRHADRIANYWLTRLRDSPPAKRLNFIYLVNDIVQNARARKRTEFPDAFSPFMAEAIQTAYRSSPAEIQHKIRRVVDVWRARNVFETPILEAIESRIEEVDKTKGSSGGGKKTLMGQSLFNSSSSTGMPKELETLAPLQTAVTKQTISARPTIDTAQTEYIKLTDPSAVLPSPPVHAARLSSLIKALAAAESSVSASIKARKALIADLERILDINKSALAKDETTFLELESRKNSTEAKKREVEDGIIRGLSAAEHVPASAENPESAILSPDLHEPSNDSGAAFHSQRPEIEALTPEREPSADEYGGFFQSPPPQQQDVGRYNPSASPRASNPAIAAALASFSGAELYTPGYSATTSTPTPSDLGGAGSLVRGRSSSGQHGMNGLSTAKRRKMSHGEDEMVPDLGEMGMEGFGQLDAGGGPAFNDEALRNLDQDVTDLLRQEGGGP